MWVLLTRRLRLWLLVTVGGPVLAWLLGRIGRSIEERRGPTRTSDLLQKASRRIRRKKADAKAETKSLGS